MELYHYGVKGMRWGVRNAETRARYKRNGVKKDLHIRKNPYGTRVPTMFYVNGYNDDKPIPSIVNPTIKKRISIIPSGV